MAENLGDTAAEAAAAAVVVVVRVATPIRLRAFLSVLNSL